MTIGGEKLGGRSFEQFKKNFFDAEAVLKAIDRAERKTLLRFGAFVPQRARTSLRYADKTSIPGGIPYAHKTTYRFKTSKKTGQTSKQAVSPLREFIFFAFDSTTHSVVIGPARTNQRNANGLNGQTVVEVLEYGGAEAIHEHLAPAVTLADGTHLPERWLRTDLRYRISEGGPRSAVNRPTRVRTAKYAARPFMHPAYDAEVPGFLESLKGSVTSGG